MWFCKKIWHCSIKNFQNVTWTLKGPRPVREFYWQQPAGASHAAWDWGDTRQGYLQDVLVRGRGDRVRAAAAAAPCPATKPPGYSTDCCAKARTENCLPYPLFILVTTYLDVGKAKTDLPLLHYCSSRLMIGYRPVTSHSSFPFKRR